MIWDMAAPFYDIVVEIKNGKVNREAKKYVASLCNKEDDVLECACGTGIFTKEMAKKGRSIRATDVSQKMIQKTAKKCKEFPNVTMEYADITNLPYPEESFDKVVAANVIHLLDEPNSAVNELLRVCKTGGMIIIPTYILKTQTSSWFLRCLSVLGIKVKNRFYEEDYRRFFQKIGMDDVVIKNVDGNMMCSVASFRKN